MDTNTLKILIPVVAVFLLDIMCWVAARANDLGENDEDNENI